MTNAEPVVLFMARGKLPFRQRDITRAVKAVSAAGVCVRCVDIKPDGSIRIVTGTGEDTIPDVNPLDQWMADNAR